MQCGQIRKMLINYALDDARMTERLCVDVHTSHCSASGKNWKTYANLSWRATGRCRTRVQLTISTR